MYDVGLTHSLRPDSIERDSYHWETHATEHWLKILTESKSIFLMKKIMIWRRKKNQCQTNHFEDPRSSSATKPESHFPVIWAALNIRTTVILGQLNAISYKVEWPGFWHGSWKLLLEGGRVCIFYKLFIVYTFSHIMSSGRSDLPPSVLSLLPSVVNLLTFDSCQKMTTVFH